MTKKDLNKEEYLHMLILEQETCEDDYYTISIVDAIEVAQRYAEHFIHLAANEAKITQVTYPNSGYSHCKVKKESILNLKHLL